MTIMLCGKISDEPNYQALFKKAREQAQERFPDAIILSPADLDLDEFTWKECMDVTLAVITGAKNVFMLKNWQDSKGAIAEHGYAKKMGFGIFFEE